MPAPAASSGPAAPASPPGLAPWRATGILVLFLLLGLGLLLGPEHAPKRVSVDVLDLLPRDELDPTIRLARQTVSGRFGRTLLIALSDTAHPRQPPVQAAAKIAGQLAANPAFAGAFTGLTPESKDQLGRWFFARRLPIRLPIWLDGLRARWQKQKGAPAGDPPADWLATQAVADLQDFQGSPEADAAQDLIPRDPLLLIPSLLAIFSDQDKSTASDVSGGALAATGSDGVHYALIQAEIKASPLSEAGQKPVFAALDKALAQAKAQFGPSLALRYTGVSKFAAESRDRAQGEISLLTNVSLGLSCLLLLAFFRRISVFVYLLLPIVAATVWSLVVCFVFFERVHVVAIIFTTVLVGVALDYGIYTLSHAQQTIGGLGRALHEIRFPLIAGCLTSVGGFVFMTLTNLPMLQQMGVAVALGLILSLALDFLYLRWMPALVFKGLPPAARQRLRLEGWLLPALGLALAAVAAGLIAARPVQWNDDVRTLEAMSKDLASEQNDMRRLFGQSDNEHIVLTFGSDLNEAFAHLATFNAALTTAATSPHDNFFNLGQVLPSVAQIQYCARYFRTHPEFTASLHTALDQSFKAGVFDPFWEAWNPWLQANQSSLVPPASPAQLMDGLGSVLPLPLRNLWNEEGGAGAAWLATRINASLFAKLAPGLISAPNAPIDQVETLNSALRRYRVTATQRAGVGLALIAVGVILVYGWRRGGFMLAVPALSMMLAVAVLCLAGQKFGLLHVVALLLGFCLASDYSIFLGSPGDLPYSTRRAILLAASTALLSFCVLSFSKIEALKDICLTVSLVIGFVLILCEGSYRLFVRPVPADS
jgi:predicted exporter